MRLPIGFQLDAFDLGPIAVAQEARIVARRRLPIGRFAGGVERLHQLVGPRREPQPPTYTPMSPL